VSVTARISHPIPAENGMRSVANNLTGRVLVRDSKDRAGGMLTFGPTAWRSFIASTTVRSAQRR
jgi:hypothetical protein